jgi:ABC-2 type transport system ATP-binding protein
VRTDVITIDDVTLAYGDRRVLDRFSLMVSAGSAVALRGRNGAGKSTLLRATAGLLRPRSGTIGIGGEPVDETRPAFRRMVAALLDDAAWYPSLTVLEHVDLVRMVAGPAPAGWWTPSELTDCLQLDRVAGDPPTRLSSGQRQRLALAMTFARASEVLLLDEPERHLDAQGRAAVADLVGRYVGGGGTALVATHDTRVSRDLRPVDLAAG